MPKPRYRCAINGRPCTEHDFVHGREAEELRKGIENIIAGKSDIYVNFEDRVDWDEVKDALQRLLDKTDARDSLAYLEAK